LLIIIKSNPGHHFIVTRSFWCPFCIMMEHKGGWDWKASLFSTRIF